MTNREQAKMKSFAGTESFLAETDNLTIYANRPAFFKRVEKFNTLYSELKKLAAKAGIDITGFSNDKKLAREAMAQKAAMLCGFAQVHLDDIEKHDIADQLFVSVTDYLISDEESLIRAQSAHDLMSTYINLLNPEYVTNENLIELQILITTFDKTHGNSISAHATSPIDTANFKIAVKILDIEISKMKLLGKFAKIDNPDFYNGLLSVTTLPPVAVRHTSVNGTIRSKDSAFIVNATISLSTSEKKGTTDKNGFFQIDQVPTGKAILTITALGKKKIDSNIIIQRGKENTFNIEMELE